MYQNNPSTFLFDPLLVGVVVDEVGSGEMHIGQVSASKYSSQGWGSASLSSTEAWRVPKATSCCYVVYRQLTL